MMSGDTVAGGGRLDFEAAAADATGSASEQSRGEHAGVAILLKAQVRDGAAEHRNCVLPDLSVVADFVSRSNGRLEVLQSSGSGYAVEIRLPRGEALRA